MKENSDPDRLSTAMPSPLVSTAPVDLREKIRQRAYELYDERGRDNGHELKDWLRAELEAQEEKESRIAA